MCKCFFGDGGKGALPAGKTGVACWNAALFSLLPQGLRSKRWALPIRKPRGIFSFKRECPPPAPLKRNVGTPPYTVTAIRFPALPGRQSCRFLESGPLYPPQAALGPLSPHPSWHKGAGCGPPLWKPLRGRGALGTDCHADPKPTCRLRRKMFLTELHSRIWGRGVHRGANRTPPDVVPFSYIRGCAVYCLFCWFGSFAGGYLLFSPMQNSLPILWKTQSGQGNIRFKFCQKLFHFA